MHGESGTHTEQNERTGHDWQSGLDRDRGRTATQHQMNGTQRGQYTDRAARATGAQKRPLTQGLGWFSIGLGIAQLAVPERVARLIGVEADNTNHALMRALGLREITSGLGILMRDQTTPWLRARVAGDVMDLALLSTILRSNRARRGQVATAVAAVAGVLVLDMFASRRPSVASDGAGRPLGGHTGISVRQQITVNRPVEEVYAFWHDLQNLPRFMTHLESVEIIGDGRSHWTAKAPAGTTVEWDAEITEDRPNELIAWRTVDGARVPNTGVVRFVPAPGERGCEVRVELEYAPPGGKPASLVAKLFGEEPNQQVQDDLRAFKQVLETGEVLRSDANPRGGHVKQRPAQPLDRPLDQGDGRGTERHAGRRVGRHTEQFAGQPA